MNNSDLSPSFFTIFFSASILKRSLITAVLVGIVLNIINQAQAIFGQAPIMWLNLILTFIVPYFVSAVSGSLSSLAHQQEQQTKRQLPQALAKRNDFAKALSELAVLTQNITQNAKNVNAAMTKAYDLIEQGEDAMHLSTKTAIDGSASNIELGNRSIALISRVKKEFAEQRTN